MSAGNQSILEVELGGAENRLINPQASMRSTRLRSRNTTLTDVLFGLAI
jgi:hypothetical protein